LKGWRSRRINTVDRLVYRVSGAGAEQALEIAQCRFHY
jgi:toxin YoeB